MLTLVESAILTYHKQIEFFEAKGYQIIAPNLRGYNGSTAPSSLYSYTINEMAKDVKHLIVDYAGRNKAIVVGHDWGGLIASTFASMYPEHCEKLVLLNMGHPNAYIKVFQTEPEAKKMATYAFVFSMPIVPPLMVARCVVVRKKVVLNNKNFLSKKTEAIMKASSSASSLIRLHNAAS